MLKDKRILTGMTNELVYRSVGDLIPYVNNARTHSDEQVAQIAASIREFGFTNPILLDGDNGVIAGHGRLLAARKLNLEEVPCIVLAGLSEAQKKAYVIADNQLALNAGWNQELLGIELKGLEDDGFDLDLLGFEPADLGDILRGDGEGLTDPDEVPEAPEVPVTKIGDLWCLGDHRLQCGDSTDAESVEKLMGGKTIDLVFTDPPYGVSYADKNAFLNADDKGNIIQREIENDHMSMEDISRLWADVFALWAQFLSDYSSYYVASPGGELLPSMMMMMNENGFPFRHMIIWSKNNHVLGRCDYNYKHEPILYGWAKKHKFYGKGSQKFTVWNYDKPLKNDLHPTMKPVALIENAILNSSEVNQTVADMFLGSGSTLIASEKTGRICYGMELDPHYCDVIINRWQDFTGKQATNQDGKTFDEVSHGSKAA